MVIDMSALGWQKSDDDLKSFKKQSGFGILQEGHFLALRIGLFIALFDFSSLFWVELCLSPWCNQISAPIQKF